MKKKVNKRKISKQKKRTHSNQHTHTMINFIKRKICVFYLHKIVIHTSCNAVMNLLDTLCVRIYLIFKTINHQEIKIERGRER